MSIVRPLEAKKPGVFGRVAGEVDVFSYKRKVWMRQSCKRQRTDGGGFQGIWGMSWANLKGEMR